MIIQRNKLLNELIERRDNGMVKVITGLRRCGKTYLVKNLYTDWLVKNGIASENIIYLALDRNENAKYRNPLYLDEFIREKVSRCSGRCYVIIDEIQYSVKIPNEYLPESERTDENAITFYDTVLGHMDDCDLYVTGSNSKMLSSDIMTNFRGRGDEVRVHPLSFSEYYNAVAGRKEDAFRQYLYYGGMPMILSIASDKQKSRYLKDLFAKTYIADIVERNEIKNETDLGAVLDFIASSTGSLINPTNIANRFASQKISSMARNTVADYIAYTENAFLITEVKRFDIRGKEYIEGQKKYYFEDTGLRNARLNFRQFDLPHLLENAVYNELAARGFSVDVGRVGIRQKNEAGKYERVYLESDFVVNDMDNRVYIQVTEGIDDAGKKDQEMKSLMHIRDGFPKMVLVNQNVPEYRTENGIIIKSVIDFLLEGNKNKDVKLN